MIVKPVEKGNGMTIRLDGRFDAEGAGVVSESLERAVHHGRRVVEIDMSGVDYLSSAGIRVLLHHYQTLRKLKGSLVLTDVPERVERVLEMAGLYDLLRPPGDVATDSGRVPAETVSLPGWTLQEYVLDRPGVLAARMIGEPCTGIVGAGGDRPCEVVPFPASIAALGLGALGYGDAECRDRFGPFIASGGIVACKPVRPDSGSSPADYVVYAEAFIPELRVLSGSILSGTFSTQISFECEDGKTVGFPDLAGYMLQKTEEKNIGFILAAECTTCVLLACGVNDHLHAALFPYHPLRLGFVKLKETVAGLFEHDLLDVLHIDPVIGTPGHVPLRLLRGVAWFSPVAGGKPG